MITDRAELLSLCGERFRATYLIASAPEEALERARDICIEQTVEFPADLIERADIRDQVIGRVESLEEIGPERCEAVIEFAVEVAGGELTQLLNVLFGNISIKPGIRLERLDLPESMGETFRGPRFGRRGLRALLDAPKRPLLSTALKPMGLSGRELAELAADFACGGIDIIKDDHGLSDQSFCRFDDRVSRCSEAVLRAAEQTGKPCLYFPNITAPADELVDRARAAKRAGAGGLVLSPGLTGFDSMRRLADDDDIALPILSHPAFLGSFTAAPGQGISHGALYGQIGRLSGADASIFPSFGGRFSFTSEECRDIVDSTLRPMGRLAPNFPAPAGGMTLERVPELLEFYGEDVILLIGGDLHRHGSNLIEGCGRFVERTNPPPTTS